jgi:hypothetical protein
MYNVVWDRYGARILTGETTLHYGTPATWADWELWVKAAGFEIVSETVEQILPPGDRKATVWAEVRRVSR